MPNNRKSAEAFVYSRDPETVRAKDLSENNLCDPAGLIHDLKMMVEYKKTLLVFKDNHGNYIQIVKWLKKGKVDKLANTLYTYITVHDFFEHLYENDILYNMSTAVAKHKGLKSKNSGNKVYKKKIDRSQGITKIINQYEKIGERDFLDLVSIGTLDYYRKFLQNRYYMYIFLEIIYEYKTHIKKLHLFYTHKNKKRKKPICLTAIKTLWEIEYLLSDELKDNLGRIEDILNENMEISQKDYEQKIKKMIVTKLKKNGLSNTSATNFYKNLKNID